MPFRMQTSKSTRDFSAQTQQLKQLIDNADAVMIGAGAGLSASAELTYSGERFTKTFGEFQAKYGIQDTYSGGFYPFETLEEYWAWWSRHIMVNRYQRAPRPLYDDLLKLMAGKDYFVLTTNIYHNFWRQVRRNPRADYVCINQGQAYAPVKSGRAVSA